MKKLLTLFLVLWCSTAWAAGPIDWSKPYARSNPYVLGAGVAAGSSCDSATNEIGSRTTYGTAYSFGADLAIVLLVTADCLGELDTANFYNSGEGTASNAKICIYTTGGSGADPDNAGNVLVKCSGAIASGTGSGWKTAAMDAGGNITSTNANAYWMMIVVDDSAAAWYQSMKNDTTTIWYMTATGYYDTPPANLGAGTWSEVGSFGPYSAYVTIK